MSLFILSVVFAHQALGGPLPSGLQKRLDNGLAVTPPMGWNSYNHYSCAPNETIIKSNAQALVDLGLLDLGYEYATCDCGWTLPDRTENDTMTWNPDRFPSGFPALGEFIHGLGLKWGVYSDSGIQMCMTGQPNQTGSLYHEQTDADTYSGWGADLLKYDNCYSDEAAGYPDSSYEPTVSPSSRFITMRDALERTGRSILYQICEWGVDFPSAWAPDVGNTWRVTNDIIPAWRTIYRILNQVVPQASYAGPHHWLDLDMLEVGNNVFNTPEEQTHFSMWAIMKSPLVIGAALKDDFTSINSESLAILKNTDVIGYNQDSLGVAANLTRRWTEAGIDVWAGLLSGDRTVAALINWNDATQDVTINLPDIGLQSAGSVKDIWNGLSQSNVKTSYSSSLVAHGTLLLELASTTPAGYYTATLFGAKSSDSITFSKVYGVTSSSAYSMTVSFATAADAASTIKVSSSAAGTPVSYTVAAGATSIIVPVSLLAVNDNTVTIASSSEVSSIDISEPEGTFYPSTSFTVSGSASLIECTTGLCEPVGSKVGWLSPTGAATLDIPRSSSAIASSRYIELTYINNEIAISTSWTNGRNARNITVSVNGGTPVRLEVPLSGHSSELYSPMLGWGDPATLGLLTDGWSTTGTGNDTIVISNVGGDAGVQSYGADFVGVRVF